MPESSFFGPSVSAASGVISSIALVGTQNNIALPTPGKNVTLLCLNETDLTINGFDKTGWETGSIIHVISAGAGNVIFNHNNAGSVEGQRINNQVSGARILVASQGSLKLVLRASPATGIVYWYVTEHDQGAWIVPTFAAGDYTANGSMTWTVESADATISYYIIGRKMTVAFRLATTTIGGSVNSLLWIKIPGGHSANRIAYAPVWITLQGPVREVGYAAAALHGATLISISRLAEGNWILSTNTTYVFGEITFEIG